MPGLAEATEAYQAQLEHVRAAEDRMEADAFEHLRADLAKARQQMEVAWLEQLAHV